MTAPERLGSLAFRCLLCAVPRPRWRVLRQGDAMVTWACSDHLVLVLADMLPTDQHRDAATVTDLENAWEPRTGATA